MGGLGDVELRALVADWGAYEEGRVRHRVPRNFLIKTTAAATAQVNINESQDHLLRTIRRTACNGRTPLEF